METAIDWLRRQEELLAKLAARAATCPGLYPIREAAEFLRVAMDHAGQEPEAVCKILEILWQRPEEAFQFNAQSLIRRGRGLGQVDSGKGTPQTSGVKGLGA